MSNDFEKMADALVALGAQIDAKIAEFKTQGVLHGAARQAAADIKLQHERIAARAARGRTNAVASLAGALATDVEILKDTFVRWLARIDAQGHRSRK